jgi:hypothetical protein
MRSPEHHQQADATQLQHKHKALQSTAKRDYAFPFSRAQHRLLWAATPAPGAPAISVPWLVGDQWGGIMAFVQFICHIYGVWCVVVGLLLLLLLLLCAACCVLRAAIFSQ